MELIKGEMPHLFITITCLVAGVVTKVHRHFCNFRRYDWSWTPEEKGEYGYYSGLYICNGGGFEFPARTFEEFYAATLAAGFERMMAGLQAEVETKVRPDGVLWDRLTEEEKDAIMDADRAVYTARLVARPVLDYLLEDAQLHTSEWFARVFEHYRQGRPAYPSDCECVGFEPESCWSEVAEGETPSVRASCEHKMPAMASLSKRMDRIAGVPEKAAA